MEPNNNDNKKKIIIALCCIFAIALLTIPFLEKDNQIPKTNKEEILNNTNKISSKKTFLFFIIIGIAVVIILIISLIILFIKRHNANKNKIDNNANNLEDFLSRRCYFAWSFGYTISIGFGDEDIDYKDNEYFFAKDIGLKQQFYQNLQNNVDLQDALFDFYKKITDFLFQIDGHLLKACYDPNNNSNTPLTQMSKKFNEEILIDQKIYNNIFQVNISKATRPLSENEKQLLNSENYVDAFKTIMQQDNIPYYIVQNIIQKQQLLNNHGSILIDKFPLFERCHAIYTTIKKLYKELTAFFNKEENKKHRDKYKLNIDNAMNEINNFLKIRQKNTQSPT